MGTTGPGASAPSTAKRAASLLLSSAVVVSAALGVRLLYLGRSPHPDEIYNILAARALLANGTFLLDEASRVPYDRAAPFTYMVATAFRLFGEGLVAARLPGVLAGTLLVLLIFLWVRSEANERAAWLAAFLLCFYPLGIALSQTGRFYAVHALVVWIAAIGVYRLTSPGTDRLRAAALVLLSVAALALAERLHVLTTVVVIGLAAWVAFAAGPRAVRWCARDRRGLWVALAFVTTSLAGGAWLVHTGVVAELWGAFRHADFWADDNRTNFTYYHVRLLVAYPTLWTLLPVFVLLGIRAHPRITLFCTCYLGVALIVHSTAAWKTERLIFHAMPAFFVLAAIGVGDILPRLRRFTEQRLSDLRSRWLSPRAIRAAAVALVIGFGLFAMAGNPAFNRLAKMLIVSEADASRFGWYPDWNAATPRLRPVADSVDVVLASSAHKSLYYLDRVDIILQARRLMHWAGWRLPDFSPPEWWFIERPVITEAGSMARIVSCNGSGLAIIDRNHWRNPLGTTESIADFLEEHTERVRVPARWGLHVFRWQTEGPLPAECDGDWMEAESVVADGGEGT